MSRPLLATLALLVALCGDARAQGNDSTTTSERASDRGGGAVTIGAGSTTAVTTGSSGPQSDASPGEAGSPAPFKIVPTSQAFIGPAPLPIAKPQKLLCAGIDHAPTRERCETRAKGGKGG